MSPPHESFMGGDDNMELLYMYREETKRKLCDHHMQKQKDNVYVSVFRRLSLNQYVQARSMDCSSRHLQPCTKCKPLLCVAELVLKAGFCTLSEAFRSSYPHQVYKADIARQRLLQMPLACIRVGNIQKGNALWYLVESFPGVDYSKFAQLLDSLFAASSFCRAGISKQEVNALLGLTSSDRERELVRYTVFKSSGLSPTAARRIFGFERMQERAACVERCIEEACKIREAINKLSMVQDKAILFSMGVDMTESASDSDSEESFPISSPEEHRSESTNQDLPSLCILQEVLEKGQYNWFEVIDFLEKNSYCSNPSMQDRLYTHMLMLPLSVECKDLITNSFKAYLESSDPVGTRTAAILNEEIVTDSESDSADDYVTMTNMISESVKRKIAQRRKTLMRRNRRLKAKVIAEKNFLSRKISRKVKTVVSTFPDIGDAIESFVSESNVGADAWRRTGVLTFDGNLKIQQKVTYERIRQHLEERYQHKFSYGTVVQLCIARNKRRRSASNYKNVARVTTRRARKGFEVRYNPDKHWSSALYRGLNLIQYTNGNDITNINRDDASGYRLDTLVTHSKHAIPTVCGQSVLTTHTDYVNRHPSILQTTSYNCTASKCTKELCAGVVKGSKVYPKNPGQHTSDLKMLSEQVELREAFINPETHHPKNIECIRVDGATDEGPSHDEVRFLWAARHLKEAKLVTLVSSRSSGSSYLNRVELQNGCLALGHSNLFIPSTLNGTNFSLESGQVDMERVKQNLEMATDVYIKRVNKSPCGETVIHLFKGSDSSEYQKMRAPLNEFLKGSKKKREKFKRDHPNLYSYVREVCDVQQRHFVPNLPPQYLYLLVCCFGDDCPHPLCKRGPNEISQSWFPGGPNLKTIPLPVPHPSYPWGNTHCDKCSAILCSGHFLTPEEALASDAPPMKEPPSSVLKTFYTNLKGREATESEVEGIAKKVLLPTGEVLIWLDHLKTVETNRKRGAMKAAETRRNKKLQNRQTEEDKYYCGVCNGVYGEDQGEYWVGCEECNSWFHGDCININPDNEPDQYFCSACVS